MWRCLLVACAIGSNAISARADTDPLATLLTRADAVAKEVSKIRGLPLKRPIEKEVVDRAELRARLLKLAAEDKTQTEMKAEGLALARWGLIPRDTDYLKLMVDLLTDQIAGYYDPKTDKLTISQSAGKDPAWAEMVLAHEIDHGLQDQSFDLDKFEDLPDGEDDASLARHALVEGDGIALMIEVMLARKKMPAPWGDPDVAAELDKAMALPTGDSLDKAPLAIREAMLFPYRAGFGFVAALRRSEPWSAVDAAFKRPPRSTEQIIHPEKYVEDDRPIVVSIDPPPSLTDYKVVHSTVWGEFGFALFLRSHGIETSTATLAAAGWGGDRVVVFAQPEEPRAARAIGIARFEWDSEPDAIEAHEAAVRAIDVASIGGTADHSETRTRWLALDGTASIVERRGISIVIAFGVPARFAEALTGELWTATTVAKTSTKPLGKPKR